MRGGPPHIIFGRPHHHLPFSLSLLLFFLFVLGGPLPLLPLPASYCLFCCSSVWLIVYDSYHLRELRETTKRRIVLRAAGLDLVSSGLCASEEASVGRSITH